MIVYIITFVVFAAILVFSYRALGGEVASAEDVDAFVDNVELWVREDLKSIAVLDSDATLDAEAVERARAVRKKLSGYQQQLARILPAENGAERASLSLAIEAVGWACRMVESESATTNPAVRRSVAALYREGMGLLKDSETVSS